MACYLTFKEFEEYWSKERPGENRLDTLKWYYELIETEKEDHGEESYLEWFNTLSLGDQLEMNSLTDDYNKAGELRSLEQAERVNPDNLDQPGKIELSEKISAIKAQLIQRLGV